MKSIALLTVFLAVVSIAHAQTATPAAGVPLDVATRRASTVSDLRYELSLSIPEALGSPLTGTTTVGFSLKDASAPVVLDFDTSRDNVTSVEANGKPAAFTYVNGHIVLPAAALVTGANTVRIDFEASGSGRDSNPQSPMLYRIPECRPPSR